MDDHCAPPPTDAQPPTPKPPQRPTPATNPSPAPPLHVVDTADAVLARPSPEPRPSRKHTIAGAPSGDGSRPSGSTEPGRLLLTVVQAAEMLAIGRTTVYQLISAGDLEVVHIGRAARVPVEAVEDLVTRLRRRAS
jgi:excisionase family DNA binding protein